MALMDEFKEEREAVFKHGTFKQKVVYIWEYYKWHIIVPILVIIAITSYIVNLLTAPDILMNGVLLNIHNIESADPSEILLPDFYKEQKIDAKHEEVSLNTNLYYTVGNDTSNYESAQVLMTWLSAGQLDFITGDASAMKELAYQEYFTDLRQYLTKEQFEKYEPYFLYIDYEVYEKRSETINNMEDASAIVLPDCTKPEDMKDPIPVMIDISKCEKMRDVYGNMTDTLVFGMTVRQTNQELTSAFLDYLME